MVPSASLISEGYHLVFHDDFWRDLRRLIATMKQATPLIASDPMREFLAAFEVSSDEARQDMKRDLSIAISRLMQIEGSIRISNEQRLDS